MIPWKDPREWMEAMRGRLWTARVRDETARFDSAIQRSVNAVYGTPKAFPVVVKAFQRASEEADVASAWAVAPFLIVVPQPGGSYLWGPSLSELHKDPIGDLAIDGDVRAVTVDIGKGSEHYEIRVYSGAGADKLLWTWANGSKGLGPYVAILGDRLYCLEAESPLRYVRLVSLDLRTGRGRRVLYEEGDRRVSLSLQKAANKALFLVADNAGRQQAFWIHEGSAKRICPEGQSFYLVGQKAGRPVYYFKTAIDAPWVAAGGAPALPSAAAQLGLEFVDLAQKLIVVRNHGMRDVYRAGKKIASFLGEVEHNPWAAWDRGEYEIRTLVPGSLPRRFESWSALEKAPGPGPGPVKTGFTNSADGTAVRWAVELPRPGTPLRGVIVVVYGAYGIPTYVSTQRWRPFLEAGIAIGFAFVRGSGDAGEAWAEAGRREGKLRGVEDTEACIRAIRTALRLPAKRTCLYGRSAGGYIVGAAVARQPQGDLFRIAYTEVPYVDVLKTAANPMLPLTEYEYLEFGDPGHKIEDFASLLRLSPIHALGPEGAPGVCVLTRTGVRDMQVLAYESVKWVDALRCGIADNSGDTCEKLVAVGKDSGHFTRGAELFLERAEDYCWILEKMLG